MRTREARRVAPGYGVSWVVCVGPNRIVVRRAAEERASSVRAGQDRQAFSFFSIHFSIFSPCDGSRPGPVRRSTASWLGATQRRPSRSTARSKTTVSRGSRSTTLAPDAIRLDGARSPVGLQVVRDTLAGRGASTDCSVRRRRRRRRGMFAESRKGRSALPAFKADRLVRRGRGREPGQRGGGWCGVRPSGGTWWSMPGRFPTGRTPARAGLVGGALIGADPESGAFRCGVNGVAGCAIPALDCQPHCQPFLVLLAVL